MREEDDMKTEINRNVKTEERFLFPVQSDKEKARESALQTLKKLAKDRPDKIGWVYDFPDKAGLPKWMACALEGKLIICFEIKETPTGVDISMPELELPISEAQATALKSYLMSLAASKINQLYVERIA